jgi:hypothetical protein
MIRTFITPTQSNYNLVLELPEEYLGQELELIVFKKQEGLVTEKKTNPIKLSDKYRGIFTKEEGKKFNEYITNARTEWDRDF